MSEMGDLFKSMREEGGRRRRKRCGSNTDLVLGYQGDINYDFEVQVIAPYQLRITTPDGKRLDYYPTSNKATWVGSNSWFKIPDIEQFIMQNFKAKKSE